MTGKKIVVWISAVTGLFLACAWGLGALPRVPAASPSSRSSEEATRPTLFASQARVPHDPQLVDKTIAFWKAGAERDKQGFLELRELAGAYLARLRETGDIADAVGAEDAARRSLSILSRGNSLAMVRLGRALLAQHRFPEALAQARNAQAIDPGSARLVVDVLIELGEYDEARRTLNSSPREKDDLNYFALLARLEEVDGRPDAALRLLREAVRLTVDRPDIPAETVAWYHAMIGHHLIDAGRLDEAERACRDALTIFPRDYRAMTFMAAVASWKANWDDAITWGTRSIEVAPQNPEALKILVDAHEALGNEEQARRIAQRFQQLAHSFPKVYDRPWALFRAERGENLDEALTLARNDLELRRDIHSYDTLGWVSFKTGKPTEADAAMKQALARGTRQATLFYHAGMIARATGDTRRAKDYFTRAHDLNPLSIPRRWLKWMESEDD